MKRPQRLWQAFERIPGLAAVIAEWEALLGPVFTPGKNLLRPNGRTASSYPCLLPIGCGCAHEVIEHGPDDIVAVCRCEPRRCETIQLLRADLVIYELNWSVLGTAAASALGADLEETEVIDLPMTRRIGTHSPYAGFRFPIYLTIQIEPDEFRRIVESLVAENEQPFILLAPTHELCKPGCEELLKKKKACFLALADFLVLEKNGTLSAARPAEQILAEFREEVIPATEGAASATFFPTPPGARWEHVSIRFKDGHTVSVKVGSAADVYNYTQMGMVNRKNGDPTVQWDLLKTFADEHCVLDWSSKKADRKNQKRRENLGADLRAFFRIDGDPFRRTRDRKGWEARFSISGEA